MKNLPQVNYKLKDLYLAAYLHASGKEINSIERDGRVCWFVFSDKDSCEKLAMQYWTNQATCLVKTYIDAIRTLKDLIYSQ